MMQNTTFFKYKRMKKPALVMAITTVMLIIGTISVAADLPAKRCMTAALMPMGLLSRS